MLFPFVTTLAILHFGAASPTSNTSISVPFDDLLSSPATFGFTSWGRDLNRQVVALRDRAKSENLDNCQCVVSALFLLGASINPPLVFQGIAQVCHTHIIMLWYCALLALLAPAH